jgi:hypothetical protein
MRKASPLTRNVVEFVPKADGMQESSQRIWEAYSSNRTRRLSAAFVMSSRPPSMRRQASAKLKPPQKS